LAPSRWAEIRALWETGETTLSELSDRYGVATRTLQAHFAKQDTVKGSKAKEIAAAVTEAVFADNFEDRDVRIAKGREARSKAFANASTIEALIMAQVQEAQKDPTASFRATGAIKALSIAAQALERIHAMKWSALGLDRQEDTDELPGIVIMDLGEEELEEMRRAQGEDDDDVDAMLVESDAE
jgi:hypothetical protein